MLVLGKYDFHPRLVPTLATLVLLPVLISLGFWQLERAEEKRQLLQDFEQQLSMPAVRLNEVDDFQHLKSYQRVTIEGRFDAEHQFLLDNKVHQGRVGYQVLTPFRLKDRPASVLINRGWVPMGTSRQDLPEFVTPAKETVIAGQIKLELADTLQIIEPVAGEHRWPSVVQWIDPVRLSSQLGYSLTPFIVLMDKQDSAGFVRDWFITRIEPEKSTSYAVQWFTLALVLLLIFVFTNLRKTEVK